ncbi:MAG: DUF3883 domain-containing protein [Acidimicrobiia bacterium]|nr:DUF3883 domain-containing protein [Acidimicrobiia bacterium]
MRCRYRPRHLGTPTRDPRAHPTCVRAGRLSQAAGRFGKTQGGCDGGHLRRAVESEDTITAVRLEYLTPGARVSGIVPSGPVTVVQVEWHGQAAITLHYKDDSGRSDHTLLYRDSEPALSLEESGPSWAFDADGTLFMLVSEARRINLAYLFDPYLAVTTSNLEPLPHQIEAVYVEMLPHHPLRYLLADDPGAGKTIMAGLLLKELMVRGDVQRCLIVAPGSLVEQWQDEMWDKFGIHFDIATRETFEASRTGNPFLEKPRLIARLDALSRNDEAQAKLAQCDFDLVVVDEAHKMAAHGYGIEVTETKRFKLGRLLGGLTRHLLLMTATPHSGKDEDFQLFLSLIDSDRFEGRPRASDGVHTVDTMGIMRRLVKENLLRFDGTRLFPERRAYSVTYTLSDEEAILYERVTEYVREEMNRADRLADGQGSRRSVVGFALTLLQRRLASSPEAIYQSLKRRRKRLEDRLREEKLAKRAKDAALETALPAAAAGLDEEDFETDLEDVPDAEAEEIGDALIDEASAAQTIAELEAEISALTELESLAAKVRASGRDRKWEELAGLLQEQQEMFDAHGNRRKLIIFTEHRDTLHYLAGRLRNLIGRDDAVVMIHGGTKREERRKIQGAFTVDKDTSILVATDAAGEGVNLQRAHLMVNYDLPWNPNRIEQRFGRIHRIGQNEVCHLWNLVAHETREGHVFHRLFEKLDSMRQALGDQVFDVLGETFADESLRHLLIKAIRYSDDPVTKKQLELIVDHNAGEGLKEVLDERAVITDVMTPTDVEEVRVAMAEAAARKLQPHYVRAFFLKAFRQLGGRIVEREPGRFEITYVPADLRSRDREIGVGAPLLRRYERVAFEKEHLAPTGHVQAEFLCPGHPLLDVTVDVLLERYGSLLRHGAVLVDDRPDVDPTPRLLVYLEHSITDARTDAHGNRRVVSRRYQFVEVTQDGKTRDAGYAPFLDYRPPTDEERPRLGDLDLDWLRSAEPERIGLDFAVSDVVPQHLGEVRRRTIDRVDKTLKAVTDRLTREITYWDHRAAELKEQELAGKKPRLNSGKARQRADDLQARLQRRTLELEEERQLHPQAPVVVGAALVVSASLLEPSPLPADEIAARAKETQRIERLAVDAVLAAERHLGRDPEEKPHNHPGFDISSRDPKSGGLVVIEVKGRVTGAPSFTITKNELLHAFNSGDDYRLALVEVAPDDTTTLRYLTQPFGNENVAFDITRVDCPWQTYWARGREPM